MEILRLLDHADWIESYEVQDYRQWEGGFYYRSTFPHHKHTPDGVFENQEITLPDVLEKIHPQIKTDSAESN